MSDAPVSDPDGSGDEPAAGDRGEDDRLPDDPARIAVYRRYVEAQQAVDTLSDRGFPMANVTIVWSGLRRIEHVTGRRTVASAARDGLMTGAWFGFVIGLLFSAFAEEVTSIVAVIASYSLVGALTVAAFQAFQHWARQGTRDFSTTSQFDAERYEVWVDPAHRAQAQAILDLPTDSDARMQP